MAGSGTRFRSGGDGGIGAGREDHDDAGDDMCSRVVDDDEQLLLLHRPFCAYDVSSKLLLFG